MSEAHRLRAVRPVRTVLRTMAALAMLAALGGCEEYNSDNLFFETAPHPPWAESPGTGAEIAR